MSGIIVVTSRSEEFWEDGNGEPVVFDPGAGFAGNILAGLFETYLAKLLALF